MRLSPDLSLTLNRADSDAEKLKDPLDKLNWPYSYMRKRLKEIGCWWIMVQPHPYLGYWDNDDFKRGLAIIKNSRQRIVSRLP